MSHEVIRAYYDAFNRGDREGLLALLTDDVAHDINQGGTEVGKDKFRTFMAHMDRCYAEKLDDMVIMVSPDGSRASAEFTVLGQYLQADSGLPPAHGQRYRLPAGTFFALRDGRISRVTTYYNHPAWLAQVK